MGSAWQRYLVWVWFLANLSLLHPLLQPWGVLCQGLCKLPGIKALAVARGLPGTPIFG